MNEFLLTIMAGAFGSVAGFLIGYGVIKARVESHGERLGRLEQFQDATEPLMQAAAQAREANNLAVTRIERRVDRLEDGQREYLSRTEYESRHRELQTQISDLKDGRFRNGT